MDPPIPDYASDEEMMEPDDVLLYCSSGDCSSTEDESGDNFESDTPADAVAETVDPPQDDAVVVLNGHKESVFCVTIDSTGTYLVSGSQEHVAMIWNLKTGNRTFTALGHEDSVTCVTFSPDSLLLATGDMAGGIRVWLHPETNTEAPWSLCHSMNVGDLLWLLWWQPLALQSDSKSGKRVPAVLAAGDSDSVITMWSMSPGSGETPKRAKYLTGSGSPVTAAVYHCPSYESMNPKILSLYQNGELRLWDVRSEALLASLQLFPDMHLNPTDSHIQDGTPLAFCLAGSPPQPLYSATCDRRDVVAVGGVGSLNLVVCRATDAPESVIRCIATIETGDSGSVEAIDFCWTHPFLAFGTVEGTIGIVDLVKLRIRQKWTHPNMLPDSTSPDTMGITALRWSQTSPVFFTATTQGVLTAWSGLLGTPDAASESAISTGSPLRTWWGHRAMVLDMALPPSELKNDKQGRSHITGQNQPMEPFIVTASDDSTVRIFQWTIDVT